MDWVRHGECNGCGACCQSLVQGLTVRFAPSITEPAYLRARGLDLHDDGTVTATGTLVAPCPQLLPALGCRWHGTPQKPQWCRDYPTAPAQIADKPCSYWFTRGDAAQGGLASPYPMTEAARG